MSATSTPSSNVETTVKKIKLGFFPGAFGGFQRALWHTLNAFGFDRKVSHKVAADFGADLGRAMRENADVAATVSKANKNNESYLKLSGKSVRVANSPAMEVSRLCTLAEAMFNEKLVSKRQFPASPTERIADYLSECGAWAAGQTFEE